MLVQYVSKSITINQPSFFSIKNRLTFFHLTSSVTSSAGNRSTGKSTFVVDESRMARAPSVSGRDDLAR